MLGYVHRRTTDHDPALDRKSAISVTCVIHADIFVFGINKFCHFLYFFYLQKWFWTQLTTHICDYFRPNGMLFQQNDINPCIYKRFCDDLDLEQHGDDFLLCGATSNLEVLADEFKNHFLVKKTEIVSLKPDHQSETHFLKRRISVDNFGWHVELDQRYVKSLLDAMAMNHCKSMATPGSKGQEGNSTTEKLDQGAGQSTWRCRRCGFNS